MRCKIATLAIGSILSGAALFLVFHRSQQSPVLASPPALLEQPGTAGTLTVSLYGNNLKVTEASRHRTVLVRNDDYAGMEDNDIRGFMDGNFKWGWNQASQVHVRMGRRPDSPRYADYEIFRVLQRWDKISLPPVSVITTVSLNLGIEGFTGHQRPLWVMLYAMKKDWNPGEGGTRHDNVSPPNPGEVWWNDSEYQKTHWGLPGANYASDDDPSSDTPAMPLAQSLYHPGDSSISFSSAELASYATQRLREQKPLLFMLKSGDFYEWTNSGVLIFYSAQQGDNKTVDRRPHLTLEWESPAERESAKKFVRLEYGRSSTVLRLKMKPMDWIS